MNESRTLGSSVEPSNGFGFSTLIPMGKVAPAGTQLYILHRNSTT